MNLYLVERTDHIDYDEYDSIVIAATSELEALSFNPYGKKKEDYDNPIYWYDEWSLPKYLKVTFLGVASSSFKNGDIICKS